ncbi:hypothetical protein VNI00_010402 [Paramarasmius palmivorus]|uniref:MACPF domain-containing protein n=1 Tax=Paramarasmius palmivorus TaxID=297713 RepID=A0AAW0CH55_9AGAR
MQQDLQSRRFEDSVSALVPAETPTPREQGETLIDVIRDPVKRAKLINDNNLLKGVIMTSDGPVASSRQLIEEPETLNATVNTVGTIDTTTVETEFSETLMQKNYNSVSVNISVPYVTATAEYSNSSSYKNTETEKSIFVSSRYLFRQGRIDFSPPGSGFDDEVKLTSGFLTVINNALAKETPTDKREALYKAFAEYGHVFRTRVQIGGVLSAHTMEVFKRSESETEVKQDIKVGLEGAVKDWGGGVGAGHGNTEGTIVTKEGRTLNVKYIVNGGDYTKIQEIAQWIASTDKPEWWRDIEVSAVVSVADMLPDDIKQTVKDLMRPLLGRWVDVERVPNTDQFPKAIYRPKDAIPSGWYWLGHTADPSRTLIVKPTLPLLAGRNPTTTNGHRGSGLTTQPFPNLPQYTFLSTYFEDFIYNLPPGSLLAALQPGLFAEGRWESHGESIATAIYITRPASHSEPGDEVFDLQPVIRVKLPGSDNPPKPRWLLKQNVVLFDSGEY